MELCLKYLAPGLNAWMTNNPILFQIPFLILFVGDGLLFSSSVFGPFNRLENPNKNKEVKDLFKIFEI